MEPPPEATELAASIIDGLASTPYPCTRLTPLGGGSINFLYRGDLARPLPQDSNDSLDYYGTTAWFVIVKHYRGYLSCNRDFELDLSRWKFEGLLLNALNTFYYQPPLSPRCPAITTPRFFASTTTSSGANEPSSTLVLQDMSPATDLKTAILTFPSSPVAVRIVSGMFLSIGAWLRAFHEWSARPEQHALRAQVAGNKAMRKLKLGVTYGIAVKVLGGFPELLVGGGREDGVVKEVVEWADREFGNDHEKEEGIIHGDFWTGNILYSQKPHPSPPPLTIIDWEYAHAGPRAFDLGQLLGDLVERAHFQKLSPAITEAAISSFTAGYRISPSSSTSTSSSSPTLSEKEEKDNEELAFHTAIHAGVHLLGWYTRRNPASPLPCAREMAVEGMRMGRDFVVKGWERDRAWFRESMLAPLFSASDS